MVIDPVTLYNLTTLTSGANALTQLYNGSQQRDSARDNILLSHRLTEQEARRRAEDARHARQTELDHPHRLFTSDPDRTRRQVEALSRRGDGWQPAVLVAAFETDKELQFGRTVRESVEKAWQIPAAPVAYGLFRRPLFHPDADLFEAHDVLAGAPTVVLFGRVHEFGRRIEPRVAVVGIDGQVRPLSLLAHSLDIAAGVDPTGVRTFAGHIADLAVMAAEGLAWAVSGTVPRRRPEHEELPAEYRAMLRAFAQLGGALHAERRGKIQAEYHRLVDGADLPPQPELRGDRHPSARPPRHQGW